MKLRNNNNNYNNFFIVGKQIYNKIVAKIIKNNRIPKIKQTKYNIINRTKMLNRLVFHLTEFIYCYEKLKLSYHMLVSSQNFVSHHLLVISHLLSYYCLKFTFARLPLNCLICLAENADIIRWAHVFPKLMLQMLQNLYLKLLCSNFTSNSTDIKQIRKSVPVAPLNPTYLTSKKTRLQQGP